MIEINGRDVTEYFKDKDIVEKLNNLTRILCGVHSQLFDMKFNKKDVIHFQEAIYLFALMNSSKGPLYITSSKIDETMEKYSELKLVSKLLNINITDEGEYYCTDFVTENSSAFQEILTELYEFYLRYSKSENSISNYDCYAKILIVGTCMFIESFVNKIPYSVEMIAKLFDFCKERSLINTMSKKEKKLFFKETESFVWKNILKEIN